MKVIAAMLLALAGAAIGAECKGKDPCIACRDCSACRYCDPKNGRGGGSCGRCRAQGNEERAKARAKRR